MKEYDEMRFDNEMWQQGYDEGWASADDWLAQHEDAMAEHGWVRLPKDADGEVIHLGDLLEITHGFDVTDIGEVTDIHLQEGKCAVSICFEGDSGVTAFPEDYRHHHAPTVEDVLREMVDEWVMASSTEDEEAAIAECAAKLQLREEA